MEKYVIRVDSLCKKYGEKSVLNDISFKVPKNSICGFLGPNGAGKTTTIKLLLGLIEPSSGSGKVLGRDICKDSISIRKRIGYLDQNPRFYNHMTAREILEFTSQFFRSDLNKIESYLDLVDLRNKANEKVGHFSGGERQRLGLAQAMVGKPELLILDEPAASLDPLGRHKVLQIMKSLKRNSTIFFSTHILNDVESVSDYLVILDRGNVVAQGPSSILIKGEESSVYEISAGNINKDFVKKLCKYKWISNIDISDEIVRISVNDTKKGDISLLRILLEDKDIIIKKFNKRENNLENIFINLIKNKNE